MNDFVVGPVAEQVLELVAAGTLDAAEFGGRIIGQPTGDLLAAGIEDGHDVSLAKVALDARDADGQEASARFDQGAGGAGVDLETSARRGRKTGPAFARGKALALGQNERAEGFARKQPRQDIREPAAGDDGVLPGQAHHAGRFQLARHPAAAQRGPFLCHQVPDAAREAAHGGDDAELPVGVLLIKAFHVGKDDHQGNAEQIRDVGREAVVVSERNRQFVDRDRIVLVHDRDDAVFEHRAKRVADVEIAGAVLEIVGGEEHLGGDESARGERFLVALHEPSLAARRHGLKVGQVAGAFGEPEDFEPGSDGARADQDDGAPPLADFVDLHRQIANAVAVEPPVFRPGQDLGTDFDDDPIGQARQFHPHQVGRGPFAGSWVFRRTFHERSRLLSQRTKRVPCRRPAGPFRMTSGGRPPRDAPPKSGQSLMSELHHECGIAAIYHFGTRTVSRLCPEQGPDEVSRLLPRMLLDIQNRGQLAAGMTSFRPRRPRLLRTHKEVGTVAEVFRLSHPGKRRSLMEKYAGRAAIGHVRYATCGQDDVSSAQPFERQHLGKRKWFAFAFNGQLANYPELREELLACKDYHLIGQTDTEIVLHHLSREIAQQDRPDFRQVMARLADRFDGAYSLVFLNAAGEMFVARDPLGIRPVCYAVDGPLFAAASESVALVNLGFPPESVHSLPPGRMVQVGPDTLDVVPFAESPRRAHCFFEWIYFANVASTLDDRSVYLSRTALGVELARREREEGSVPIDEDTIVVPVPDTSKAAADAMAYELRIPSREGLIRNRYAGRTFIEGASSRSDKARSKYTPLPEVLEGKRVFLVEDSIVRSTTMKVLLERIRTLGRAREIHVRVACPPIIAPCFYGIDMSRISELFAPKFCGQGQLTRQHEQAMARLLGCEPLRYLPTEAIARAIGRPAGELCQGCITGTYPSCGGNRQYEVALQRFAGGQDTRRTYEVASP